MVRPIGGVLVGGSFGYLAGYLFGQTTQPDISTLARVGENVCVVLGCGLGAIAGAIAGAALEIVEAITKGKTPKGAETSPTP
jgi:hypothetical protein